MSIMKKWISIVVLGFVAVAAAGQPGTYWSKPVPIPEVEAEDKICFALYTVQDAVLKMMVQLYPLTRQDSRLVQPGGS